MKNDHAGETPDGDANATTFELKIFFARDGARAGEAGANLKRDTLRWLITNGMNDYVEGVIDGVDLLVEGEDPLLAFEDQKLDATPVSIFSYDEERLASLMMQLAAAFGEEGLRCRLEAFATAAWTSAWDDNFAGLKTRIFHVLRPGDAASDEDTMLKIELMPGTAFGAGDHATTLAALTAFEDLCLPAGANPGSVKIVVGERFLDVGTGTGILAIAAHKAGFRHVVGTDIDDEVLAEASRNAALNGAAMGLIRCAAPPLAEAPYDMIAANILVPVLHELMPRFAALLAPGGRLILAGFVGKDVTALVARGVENGLVEVFSARRSVRGWISLVLERSA